MAILLLAAGEAKGSHSGTVSSPWGGSATGALHGDSGDVWVTGSSSLSTPGNNTYNNWATTWANSPYFVVVGQEGLYLFHLDVSFEASLSAKAHYVHTDPAYLETYRAETTCTAEVRGHFSAFAESQIVVDSYSSTGSSYYNALGGGSPAITYYDEGWSNVLHGPGPMSGTVDNNRTFGAYCDQWYTGQGVSFDLYARGKQYIHNANEEDVSLYTSISHQDTDRPGWIGRLYIYNDLLQLIAVVILP